ncbi:MAG: ribosome silencing factor [Woeseiaceae bacterium]
MNSKQLCELAVEALEDIKGIDIKTLDVLSKSSVTDIMVFASGSSSRQVKSLANSVADKAKKAGFPALGVEGDEANEWILVDLGDVVVHVMQTATREFYNLEKLWGDDSPEVSE